MMRFERLDVSQLGMKLVDSIYEISSAFPSEEKYVLTTQIHDAAISIPSNISEGHARNSRRDYARFVSHAQGSTAEVFTQLQIATNLGYVAGHNLDQVWDDIDHLARGLNRLRTSLLQPFRLPNLESRISNRQSRRR